MATESDWIATWAEEVDEAWQAHRRSAWHVADLIADGLEEFTSINRAELIEMLALQIGVAEKTLSNYARVSRGFPPPARYDGLEFGHHEAVLKYSDEERRKWLDLAQENNWSVHRLRMEIRAGDGDEPVELPDPVAAERLLYRMGVKASIGKKKAKLSNNGFVIVVKSDGDLEWSGLEARNGS